MKENLLQILRECGLTDRDAGIAMARIVTLATIIPAKRSTDARARLELTLNHLQGAITQLDGLERDDDNLAMRVRLRCTIHPQDALIEMWLALEDLYQQHYPDGRQLRKHTEIIRALEGVWQDLNLNPTISFESTYCRAVAACTGLDVESAIKAIQRHRTGADKKAEK